MVKPPEYDDIIWQIDQIPKGWNHNEPIRFTITAYRQDAAWISSRIFEEVDRNLISTTIQAKSSKYSVELDVTIIVLIGIAGKKAIELLLEELRDYLKRKWGTRQRRKRKHYP